MKEKKMPRKKTDWLPLLAAFLIPGAGHVLLGKSQRGMILLFWIAVFGFLTSQLAGEDVSFIGRYAGGFAVWVISILEVYRIIKRN